MIKERSYSRNARSNYAEVEFYAEVKVSISVHA